MNRTFQQDGLRWLLWLLVVVTAFANRQHYRMATTWLPHLLTNSLSLLLPDALRLLFAPRHRPRHIVEDTLVTMARDNPNYAIYAAPLALGYILSHPRFNIYKGDWAELRLGGFGLDALPHSATAFAFSALAADTFETMGQRRQYAGMLADFMRWGRRRPQLLSLALLGLVTLGWEYSEYRVHQREMAQRGDMSRINMQWSMADTARDVAANLAGWGAAMLWRRNKR
jgi:hypothetical protein